MRLCLLDFVEVIEKQAGWQSSGPDFQLDTVLHDSHCLAFGKREARDMIGFKILIYYVYNIDFSQHIS